MTDSDPSGPTMSRRRVLASVGAGATALGAIPVVYQGSTRATALVVGHRGVAGLEAPNSIAGIRRAEEMGADGVSLDVQETADGELILFHDPVLDVSTTGSGFVENTTLSEIREIEVEGEPIPTLQEGLEVLSGTEMSLFLELKTAGYARKTLDVLREFDFVDRTVVTSFEAETLTEMESIPTELGMLGSVPSPGLFTDATATGSSLVMSHYVPYGIEWLIEEAHANGMQAGIWELASTEAHIEDALSFDIDILTTNRPDIALERMGR